MARRHASITTTSCAPVYDEGMCWGGNEQDSGMSTGGSCITTKYRAFLYRGGEALLCTAEEAKAAEAAANEGTQEELDEDNHHGTSHAKRDAADATIRSIARGERFVAARADTPDCI